MTRRTILSNRIKFYLTICLTFSAGWLKLRCHSEIKLSAGRRNVEGRLALFCIQRLTVITTALARSGNAVLPLRRCRAPKTRKRSHVLWCAKKLQGLFGFRINYSGCPDADGDNDAWAQPSWPATLQNKHFSKHRGHSVIEAIAEFQAESEIITVFFFLKVIQRVGKHLLSNFRRTKPVSSPY